MNNWKNATKELRQAGIRVNMSISSCCIGCAELPNLEPNEPAIYSLTTRFNGRDGGIAYHQNIADTELADKVFEILDRNQVDIAWNSSDETVMLIG
jgi:hypothetical protein